ncbi:hypothetical protein [Methylobacterium durans]|uniref:hypothetical protein n=1 Tax=Methylobacterium durans TaxID=2202825 RepID=UPI0013A588E7|nr:hypothetical protein [Methylobacterium durans]
MLARWFKVVSSVANTIKLGPMSVPDAAAGSFLNEFIQVRGKVERGEWSVTQAEEWAEAKGWELYRFVYPEAGSDRLSEPFWPLPLATAWILSRVPDEALAAWRQYKVWGRALRREQPWAEAVEELWHRLMGDALAAWGRPSGTRERVRIPAEAWLDLTWERLGSVEDVRPRHAKGISYRDVRLKAEDVRALWPAMKPGTAKAKATAAAEKDCRRELTKLMRAAPDGPTSKAALRDRFPQVSNRGFERAYRSAAQEAQAPRWQAPGRRARKSPQD